MAPDAAKAQKSAKAAPKSPKLRSGPPVNGWLVIDKPLGMTSTQVVGRVRRVLQPRKVGHGGTLDPLATGLLPIAMGEATKTVSYVMDGRKSYRFTLRWGQATETDDSEGAVIGEAEGRPDETAIQAVLPGFTGEIEQIPPLYSAIKVGGKRAYDLARAQADFELKPRRVMVHEITLRAMPDRDHAVFDVHCGKGTYMRSLARDLGRACGTLAYITDLRRLTVGPFTETDAISLESLESMGHSPAALEQVLPVETALDDIPALELSETEANRLRCGQAVSMVARANRDRISDLSNGSIVFTTSGGKPVALARYEAGDVHPVRVLNL
ncbi:tRNA pseudouridine(55) synthase TruB [Pelagibius sp.]|uniref:tRNA pseudouridine(55) synthase TruB n=1 Tax=Pelagibius sp. TaxID=1931238 RepID=UPI003BAF46EA